MNWFKHLSRARHDPFIADLLEAHRGDGYLFHFGTLEIYAENWRPEPGWFLDVSLSFLKRELHFYHLGRMRKIIEFISRWPDIDGSGYRPRLGRDNEEMIERLSEKSDDLSAISATSIRHLPTIYPKWLVNLSDRRMALLIPNFSIIMDEYSKKRRNKRDKMSGQWPDSVQHRREEKRGDEKKRAGADELGPVFADILSDCNTLEQLPEKRGRRFPGPSFVGACLKERHHPCAIRDATAALIDQWDNIDGDPWPYGLQIVKSCEQRYKQQPVNGRHVQLLFGDFFDRGFGGQ